MAQVSPHPLPLATPSGARPVRLLLLGCGLLIEAWVVLALLEPPGADIPRHVVRALGAWAVYLVAIRATLALPAAGRRWDLVLIFGGALILRATMLATSPTLSDDVYRHVWDARLVHAGLNPYEHAPSAPELAPFRDDEIWPRVNHKDQRTPYPPLAELLGAAAYWVLPERLVPMQGLAAGMDIFSAALLAWLLHRCGGDARRCIVIAWSPLGILHFAHSGHNDAAMIALFLAAAVALTAGHRGLALAGLGLSTAVKVVPLLMLPAFLRAAGPLAIIGWAAAGLLVALPFAGAGLDLIAGLSSETGQRFNESLYLVAERLAVIILPAHAGLLAGVVGAAVVVGVVAATLVSGQRSPTGALVSGSWVMAAYLLAAPVVEPWYFTWLAPLVAIRIAPGRAGFASNDALAWLWLSGVSVLTDLTYPVGGSSLWVPIRLVEYLPVYALLALLAYRWGHAQPRMKKPRLR